MHRTVTPSMVELPKYSGSWGSVDSQESVEEKKGLQDGEPTGTELSKRRDKELPKLPEDGNKKVQGKMTSYYDDASDEEEARDIGVARTSSKRTEMSRKLS